MDRTLTAGLVLAVAVVGSMFVFGGRRFWVRAAVGGLVMGGFGAVAQHGRLRHYLTATPADIAIGAGAAVLLYLVFWGGDRILARAFPKLSREVSDLYRLRAATMGIAALIAVVAVCEELFWRGLVQARANVLVATLGYALVLIWERKLVLIVAAIVCGGTWGALFAWRDTLMAPMLSHVLWDLAIMVVLPVRTARSSNASAAR